MPVFEPVCIQSGFYYWHKQKSMSKKSTRIISVLGIVIVAAAILAYRLGWLGGAPAAPESGENASAPAPGPSARGGGVLPIKALRIQPASVIDFITVNGSTAPNEEVTVSSEVPGKVVKILFNEGSWVEKGAPLIQLDDTELQAQRKRLLVQQELNQKIAERLKALYEREGVSLQEYEVARAEVEKVKADIALLDAQIAKRTIRAPFSGRLGLRQVSEGSYLSPGTAIVNLVSLNPIQLEFSIPEKYSRGVGQGSKVVFRLDGTNQDISATVVASEPNIDPATRTFRLKASAPNANGRILPGAFASVTVNLEEYGAAIMVPTEAIIPELGGKKVYLYRSGKAQPVSVETGIRQEASIQVTSGLQTGDTLITTGILQLRPGIDVTITELD